MDSERANSRRRAWRSARAAAWVAGALCLSVPYNQFLRLGNGNLGHNLLLTLALAALGIAVLVPVTTWLGRRCRLSDGRRSVAAGRLLVGGFAILACVMLAGVWIDLPAWVPPVGALPAIGALWAAYRAGAQSRQPFCRASWRRWMRRRWPYNGAFWLVVFLLLAGGDLFELSSLDGLNVFEFGSAALARLTTQAFLTIGLMLLFHALRCLTPRCFRPLLLALFALLPFLIVTDFLLRQFWNQSLLAVLNLFTSTGEFDFDKEMAAAGLNWSFGQVVLAGVAVLALCLAMFWGLGRLSTGAGLRTAYRRGLAALSVCWLVAVAEGGLSHATKRTEIWQRQHKAFGMHVGVFAPPLGFERIAVSFREPAPEPSREELLAEVQDAPGLRKPDIYVFMVESWRRDSVRPEVAPFLSEFQASEAQDLGTTFAGSNCTPLSWFSFFHSRVAIHWSEALEARSGERGLPGAYPLRVLDKLGYEIHVRAVCDLGYKNMGPLNFGGDSYLAYHLRDDSGRTEPMSIPRREIAALGEMKRYLHTGPPRPQFHFMALDSPHYNYYWPEGFRVPHQDCANNIPTNLRPGGDVIEGVVRRYENSVHWIDYAIREFVEFLKFEGRYENSVIVITGDHGEEFQEEGSWFHCSSLNRYQTEVPIIIKWPTWAGDLPAQTNVTHLDVMPSVLELIGLEPKFYKGLSGQSLLRDHGAPREAVISTVHRGETGIGLCLVRGDRKVKFAFGGPWSTRAPDQLHVTAYTDLLDQPVEFRDELGIGTHAEYIKGQFPSVTGRFFERFEKD